MKYLLLIHEDETRYDRITEEENAAFMGEFGQFSQAVKESGAFVTAHRLRPTTTATTVRVQDGKTLTTDGPFAETKEQLGGFYLVEAANLDEAIAWAEKIPSARYGSIEIRPIWDMQADQTSSCS